MTDMCRVLNSFVFSRYAKKWIDKATANERLRRLKEDFGESDEKDPMKETMKVVIMRMQRQMILNKFKGNWVGWN